jgi:Zn-dependent protease
MRFRLFGVPVVIQAWFWISTVFLWFASRAPLATLPIWAAVVFVSILVHEFGHAIAIRRHHVGASITLHAMGGVTTWGATPSRLGRLDRAIVSLAGPFAGFLFGGLVYAFDHLVPREPNAVVDLAIHYLLWVNIGWGLINLAPVLPWDGGHVMEEVLGPRRARTAALVSLVAAVALTVYFMVTGSAWGAILFGMSAIQSWQRWQLPPGAVLVDPLTQPSGRGGPWSSSAGGGGPGPLRRWWLKLRLRRLQAEADAMSHEKAPRRRAGGPDLRVIEGGRRDEPPKDKRYLN